MRDRASAGPGARRSKNRTISSEFALTQQAAADADGPRRGTVLAARDELSGAWVDVLELDPTHVVFAAGRGFAVGQEVALALPVGRIELRGTVREASVPLMYGGSAVLAELVAPAVGVARSVLGLSRALLAQARAPRPPAEREVIASPARVREVLHSLVSNRARGLLRSRGAWPRDWLITAARIETGEEFPMHWRLDGPWPEPPFDVEIEGYNSVFRFEARAYGESDGFLALGVPDELVRVRHRRHRRVDAPAEVAVSVMHPLWPQIHVLRPVRDVSWDGLSFNTVVDRDLIFPGLTFEVTVEWQGRARIRARARVCHVSDDRRGAAECVGVALEFDTADDQTRWHAEVQALLHDQTRADGTFVRDLWEMYDRSGYFNLSDKSAADFAPLRQPFAETTRRVARAPELGLQVVWPSARGVEAAVSMLRVYDGTTVLYQLARQRGRTPVWAAGRKILRDVYLHAIECTQRDASLRWLLVWTQVSARFSRLVHHALPERYVAGGRAVIRRFRALEGSCDSPPGAGLPTRVSTASGDDVQRLLAVLAADVPGPYLDAHDLVPERFTLGSISGAWRAAGLARERHVLAARAASGRAVAVAVLDAADNGLHAFGLLDTVRLVALEPGGRAEFGALLAHAREWYRARGKRTFVYVAEDEEVENPDLRGLRDLGVADASILPMDLAPELLEHVWELTAPRDVPPLPAAGGPRGPTR